MISICFAVGHTTSSLLLLAQITANKQQAKSHLVGTAGLDRFYHYEFGLQSVLQLMRSTLMAETCRELTVELQRSVYPSVRLLEGIAYAEDGWIDILLGYDGFNVQFITVISNNLLLFHGIKGWEAAALECYERKWGGEREEHLQGTLKPSVEGRVAFKQSTVSEFQVLGTCHPAAIWRVQYCIRRKLQKPIVYAIYLSSQNIKHLQKPRIRPCHLYLGHHPGAIY